MADVGTVVRIVIWVMLLGCLSAQGLSKKALKLKRLQVKKNGEAKARPHADRGEVGLGSDGQRNSIEEDDDFGDFDLDSSFSDAFDDDDWLTGCDGEDEDIGFGCSGNKTVDGPLEVRLRDPIFERLFVQVWSDYQAKLNENASLYGLVVDPLDIDSLLQEPISISQKSNAYSADVSMHGIKMHGLSGIKLTESLVTRSENLTDISAKITFSFNQLSINGSYSLKGFVGFWDLDSEGEQNFAIEIVNATLSAEVTLALIDPSMDWSALCNGDGSRSFEDTVLVTDVGLPLKYDDVNFRFVNLGSFANSVVNGVGLYFLQSQEELLDDTIRKFIKQNVNSLIC